MLPDDQKFISMKFHYFENTHGDVTTYKFIHTKDEFEQNKDDPNLNELNTGWRLLSWADYNRIYDECLEQDDNGKAVLNLIKFRDIKLKTCLKTWDIQDKNGEPVPVNDETIGRLHHDVASELLDGFERVTEITAEELKILELSAEAFFEGKKTTEPPPRIVYEFYVAKQLHEKMEHVRSLPFHSFLKLLKIALTWEGVQRKLEGELATAGFAKKSFF